MRVTRRSATLWAAGTTAVALTAWVALGTPWPGERGGPDVLGQDPIPTPTFEAPHRTQSPTPTPSASASASPSPSRPPSPSASPSARRVPRSTPSASPSATRTPSPSPAAIDGDIGDGPYASVLPHVGYGFCPCDSFNWQSPPPVAGLSLSCEPPGKLPAGRLVRLSITVKNSTGASISFAELAGPRLVYLSLANDPDRSKDQNGGFADNAGHTSAAHGWWADSDQATAYRHGAGTVSHVVPAHGAITVTVLGATVRTKDATPLEAGPYTLQAGLLYEQAGSGSVAWTCPGVSATVG